jgi:hypothetical protein
VAITQVKRVLTGVQPLPGNRLQRLRVLRGIADPMCSMSRDPRRLEYTIWTAVALLAVFTVRM